MPTDADRAIDGEGSGPIVRFVNAPPAIAPVLSSSSGRGHANGTKARADKLTNDQIIEAYRQTGSVWRAAKSLGINGQVVHDRLTALQYPLAGRNWSDTEVSELQSLVANGVLLAEAARRIGRPFSGVAAKASALGLYTRRGRTKKKTLPRGAGYDKESTRKNIRLLLTFDGPITRFSKSHGLSVEHFTRAFQTHFPDEWENYVSSHNTGERKTCEYCGEFFYPVNGKQRFCDRKCGSDSRVDASYFGGNRRSTIGWKDQTCQLCGRSNIKGITPHHVLGKENDPEDSYLLAVCRGCHQIITILGSKSAEFIDNPVRWETLISLVWLRKHGAEVSSAPQGSEIAVCVEIEEMAPELEEYGEARLTE